MKNTYLLLALLLFACNQPKTEVPVIPNELKKKTSVANEKVEVKSPDPCPYKKSKKTRKNTFPFNTSTDIAFVSYSQVRGGGQNGMHDKLIHNGKLDVDSLIKQKVMLNSAQKDSLFSLLYYRPNTDTSRMRMGDRCGYSPMHGIAFYQNKKTIAYIEICFQCAKMNDGDTHLRFSSYGCPAGNWCVLKRLFYDAGIKDGYQVGNCW